jgi:hypothetical protein
MKEAGTKNNRRHAKMGILASSPYKRGLITFVNPNTAKYKLMVFNENAM